MHDVIEAKRALRAAAKAARERAHAGTGARAGAALRDLFVATVPVPEAAAVAGYWPMGAEFDVVPLLTGLAARGHVCALPVVVARGQPLAFHRWRPGDAL